MTYNMMYELTEENMFEVSEIDLDKWKYFYPDAQEMTPQHMQLIVIQSRLLETLSIFLSLNIYLVY